MIKVTENGVPLAAIASVEIREPFAPVPLIHRPMCEPLLKLPMSEAEARRLREEWRKAWPEVAAYLTDK